MMSINGEIYGIKAKKYKLLNHISIIRSASTILLVTFYSSVAKLSPLMKDSIAIYALRLIVKRSTILQSLVKL